MMNICNPYRNKCLFSKKWQLVNWATERWPNDKYKFNKMKKKQLYAIWYSQRDK